MANWKVLPTPGGTMRRLDIELYVNRSNFSFGIQHFVKKCGKKFWTNQIILLIRESLCVFPQVLDALAVCWMYVIVKRINIVS